VIEMLIHKFASLVNILYLGSLNAAILPKVLETKVRAKLIFKERMTMLRSVIAEK